jgi:hypothetical protein
VVRVEGADEGGDTIGHVGDEVPEAVEESHPRGFWGLDVP